MRFEVSLHLRCVSTVKSEHLGKERTGDTNAILVHRLNTLTLENVVHLWARAMEDDRVETEAVKEAEAKSKLLEVVEDSASNFDDCKFCRLGWVGGGRENAQVTFDLTFGTEGVEQARNCVLHGCQHSGDDSAVKKTDSVCLSNGLDGSNRVPTTLDCQCSLTMASYDDSLCCEVQSSRK